VSERSPDDSSVSELAVSRSLALFAVHPVARCPGFYDVVQLVNYVRTRVSEVGASGVDAVVAGLLEDGSTSGSLPPWRDERYLVPVLESDGFLAYDWGWGDDDDGDGGGDSPRPGCGASEGRTTEEELREVMGGLDLNDPAIVEMLVSVGASRDVSGCRDTAVDGSGRRAGAASDENDLKDMNDKNDKNEKNDIDACYFASYSTFDIHKEMLQDRVRTLAYQTALEKNPALVSGSSVLDVGCGTGVLSMFAARGGAARVVGIDGSAVIAAVAKDLCARNGFSGTVRVVSSRVEALCDEVEDVAPGALEALEALEGTLGGPAEFDVLVSEWMGYSLLFESMLDSVLLARDRFLKPGGAVLPDIANLYVALGAAGAEGLRFWDDVYGLDMGAVGGALREQGMRATIIRVVDEADMLSPGVKFHSLDLARMARDEQDFSSAEFCVMTKAGAETAAAEAATATCFVLWFDTEFSSRFCTEMPAVLGTGPNETATHWAQTVLPLKETIDLKGCQGVKGRISMSRQKVHRTLDISVEYRVVTGGGEGPTVTQLFSIGVKE